MEKAINPKNFIKFFEQTAGVQFVDADTGESALKTIAKNKLEGASDYDVWLEQQDESIKTEQEMGYL
ncbi:MAG: hypothetical protein AAB416_04505 [Patescibacteria group bacterium]